MKSQVFFLVTVLLVCSSYANDNINIPQVSSSNVHRKLSIIGGIIGKGATNVGKETFKTGTKATSKTNVPKNVPVKTPVKINNGLVPKATLENNVERLLGVGAKRGFRVGFEIGNVYYSVQNECQQTLQCKPAFSSPDSCVRSPLMSNCVPFCVVQVQLDKGISNCYQTFGEPRQTPCTSSNGVLYSKNGAIPYESYRTECVFN